MSGEQELFAALVELALEVIFQAESTDYVIEDQNQRHWIHQPVEGGENQELHLLDRHWFKHILGALYLFDEMLKIYRKGGVRLFEHSSQREASDSCKLDHPWLVLLVKVGAFVKEPVKVVGTMSCWLVQFFSSLTWNHVLQYPVAYNFSPLSN